MAVTFFNANSTAGAASATARTLLHTATTGAVLLVWTHSNSTTSLSAMAAGTNAMSRLGLVSAGGTTIELWALSSCPTGILTISAIPVGVANPRWCMAAASYIGNREIGGSPFGTVVVGTAAAVANVAFSLSSTTTDLVAFGFGISANAGVTLTTGNTRASATASTGVRLVIGDVTGAPTNSISATSTAAGVWGWLGVPIIASPTATTSIRFDNAAFTSTTTNANSIGMLLTATAGAVLMVFTHVGGGSQTLSSVAINGTALTFLTAVDFPSLIGRRAELWVMTAPPTGVLTISAVIAGAGATSFGMGGITYTGHRTTATPFGGAPIASASVTASTSLVISSTAGNVAVFGFMNDFSPGAAAIVGPGLTLRTNTTSWPHVVIADTPGRNNVTGSAVAINTTQWGNIGVNLIQSGPAVNVTGNFLATDINDTFVGTGAVRVTARLSATDVIDKFSASGGVRVLGGLSATDILDTFSASGGVRVTGRLSATGALDTFSASGGVRILGRLSATDVTDSFSASGTLVGANVTGLLVATDTRDTFSASGGVLVQGLLSATDRLDTFSASGNVLIVGRLSATDATDIFTGIANNVSESAAVVVTTPSPSAGGGGYESRAPADFWEVRAKYLESLQPAIGSEPDHIVPLDQPLPASTQPPVVDPSILTNLRIERAKVIEVIPLTTNLRQLRLQGRRLVQVNEQIAQQKHLQRLADHHAALLEAQRKRRILRAQERRKAKRKLKLLVSSLALAALSTIRIK